MVVACEAETPAVVAQAPEARDGKALQAPNQFNYTTRVPLGPVGIITPWNTPFMLSTWKLAQALAAGCTVVHKPAEFSPLSARLLVEIAESAGLTEPQFNACINDNAQLKALNDRVQSYIDKDGIDSTPTFVVNGKKLVGEQTMADLDKAIAAAQSGS